MRLGAPHSSAGCWEREEKERCHGFYFVIVVALLLAVDCMYRNMATEMHYTIAVAHTNCYCCRCSFFRLKFVKRLSFALLIIQSETALHCTALDDIWYFASCFLLLPSGGVHGRIAMWCSLRKRIKGVALLLLMRACVRAWMSLGDERAAPAPHCRFPISFLVI